MSQAELDAIAALANAGRAAEAAQQALALLKRDPDSPQLLLLGGSACFALGDYAKAIDLFHSLTQLAPNDPLAHYNLGISLHEGGQIEAAIGQYCEVIALQPDLAPAHNNLGSCLFTLKRLDESAQSYAMATCIDPSYAVAFGNLGTVLTELHRHDEAMAAFLAALQLNPSLAEVRYSLGNLHFAQRAFETALAEFDAVLALVPHHADALNMRGGALSALGRGPEAEAAYRQTLALNPDHAWAHNNLGILLLDTDRLDEAAAHFDAAASLDPANHAVRALDLHTRAQMCDWSAFADFAMLQDNLGLTPDAAPTEPFALLAFDADPQRQRQRAENYARKVFARSAGQGDPTAPSRSGKLRIGYFSSDFHQHPTMFLLAGVLREHDRDAFEIQLYNCGSHHHEAIDAMLATYADRVIDISKTGNEEAARLAREGALDIAIDLKGYTAQSRPQIFGFRPAPVQIAWLGYPGTMGTCPIDYLIADHVVIPLGVEPCYAEAIIRLPDSYQPNDNLREISTRQFTRCELGLPDRGFVFASFNTSYKFSPAEFDIWMRLLKRVEGSALWLLGTNQWAEANLRREAEARGVDPQRLVFATFAPVAEHLARLRCADLFLDTFAYNAHTTASDALWTGLPVLTLPGKSFAARVAASLLHAAGLPELVATSAAEYEQLALTLASDPERLAAIRSKLAANRETCALFDTPRFTRHLEAAYREAWRRHASSEGVASFDVSKF